MPIARLARLGFSDAEKSAGLIAAIDQLDAESAVVAAAGRAADPDLAILLLSRIIDAAGAATSTSMLEHLDAQQRTRERLMAVLGASQAMGEHLVRHPEDWQLLAADQPFSAAPARVGLLNSVGADPDSAFPAAKLDNAEALLALRVAYRQRLLVLAADDLTGQLSFEVVASTLSELADAVLETCLAIARAAEPDAASVRLAVIAMGKCGANELNYISDVDVIFVAEPMPGVDETAALSVANRLATGMMRAAIAPTAEGSIWEVDPNLRPEGRNGALVRTLSSHVEYYKRWASTWEFQALLKARAAAGDAELGSDYVAAVSEFVWAAADRPNFVEDVQAMRRRVEQHSATKQADRQLKLGPGGLRDVEFSVQLLQLVHGRSDVMIRRSNTLEALEALSNWGYVGRTDAAEMANSYRFLRTMEHRLQLYRLKRTHVVPDDEAALRRLGRSMGFTSDPVAELTKAWRGHGNKARRLHEKLFYRPLLNAVARLDAEGARLTTAAATDRLRALGFRDPDGALRHMAALTDGVSRRALMQRTLLPVMLGWFADAPNPDAGLLAFRQVSDELGATPWYLRLLRDESIVAQRLALVLGSSRYASDLILRAPEGVALLASEEELRPRSRQTLEAEAFSVANRHDDPVAASAAVRALRRRELYRNAVADITLQPDVLITATALSDLTAAVISGTLQIAIRELARQRGHELRVRFAVIGMGRFGGQELGYGSDADVMFVYEPNPGVADEDAHQDALAIANELRRLLTMRSADPPLELDVDLRPEGRNGPYVRSLASYRAYYERWSSPWESQALVRALPIAGDSELCAAFIELIDPLRYPQGGLDSTALREMRRLKARMEAERLPRGADPTLQTKLGRGGLSDVEWTVQLLQMQHGHEFPELRRTQTLPALAAAAAAGLIESGDADQLADAWRHATAMRDAIMLVSGKPADSPPSNLHELAAVARVLGRPADEPAAQILEEYRRVTRRARQVVERVFFGLDPT